MNGGNCPSANTDIVFMLYKRYRSLRPSDLVFSLPVLHAMSITDVAISPRQLLEFLEEKLSKIGDFLIFIMA